MEDVKKWLSLINKREYANSLEVKRWENMNAIKMMEIQDVKDCVSKPGHVDVVQMFAEVQKLKDATKPKGHDSHEETEGTTTSTDSATQTQRCRCFNVTNCFEWPLKYCS